MKSLIFAATLALVPFSTPAWASGAGERAAHFEGKPSATLAQAVANFNEYNLKLKAILDGKLTDAEKDACGHRGRAWRALLAEFGGS